MKLTHGILSTLLCGRFYYHSHCILEQTKHRGWYLSLVSQLVRHLSIDPISYPLVSQTVAQARTETQTSHLLLLHEKPIQNQCKKNKESKPRRMLSRSIPNHLIICKGLLTVLYVIEIFRGEGYVLHVHRVWGLHRCMI